jgi:hypothetical protein
MRCIPCQSCRVLFAEIDVWLLQPKLLLLAAADRLAIAREQWNQRAASVREATARADG